ncbi:MAG: hypothetical protein U9N02_05025 [Campylobacterota bacterium]|nr:hypothetical protein [Campylobacterota bacterium]
MKKILKLLENIALGIFINGSYGYLYGDVSSLNLYIIFGSIYLMYISILYQED